VTLEEVTIDYMYSNPEGQFNLSVPHKMRKNANFVSESYHSYRIMQMRTNEGFTGPKAQAMDLIKCKTWDTDKKSGPAMLTLNIKNKANLQTRCTIRLFVDDNERKNVVFPCTELKDMVFGSETKQSYHFLKIDPSKDGWGDIGVEVSSKPGKTTNISTTGTGNYGGSYSSGVPNYGPISMGWGDGMGMMDGSSIGTSMGTGMDSGYKPHGVVEGDATH